MKKFNSFILVFITAILVAVSCQSCKKSSSTAVEKGCNDPEAVDYSAQAKGTICSYPSDHLAGTWTVSEFESKDSITIGYTATITKVDNHSINIKNNSDYPTPVSSWHEDNITLQIHWADKTFVPNGTMTGIISDVNNRFHVSYTSGIYNIKQTYSK